VAIVRTGLRPEACFAFGNRFDVELLGRAVTYGLCGGMCFGALDYYARGSRVPDGGEPPALGSPLYRFLVRRQVDSLSHPTVLPRIAGWMLAGAERVRRWTLERQLPRVLLAIDAGEPVVMVVLRETGIRDPTRNHQVVAIGYSLDAGRLSILLYEPNHPLQEHAITVGDTGVGALAQTTGEAVIGFFVQRYRSWVGPLPT